MTVSNNKVNEMIKNSLENSVIDINDPGAHKILDMALFLINNLGNESNEIRIDSSLEAKLYELILSYAEDELNENS